MSSSGGIGVRLTSGGGTDAAEIGVGMLGYAFMGKAHANAYRTLPYMAWPPPLCAAAGLDRGPRRGGRS